MDIANETKFDNSIFLTTGEPLNPFWKLIVCILHAKLICYRVQNVFRVIFLIYEVHNHGHIFQLLWIIDKNWNLLIFINQYDIMIFFHTFFNCYIALHWFFTLNTESNHIINCVKLCTISTMIYLRKVFEKSFPEKVQNLNLNTSLFSSTPLSIQVYNIIELNSVHNAWNFQCISEKKPVTYQSIIMQSILQIGAWVRPYGNLT